LNDGDIVHLLGDHQPQLRCVLSVDTERAEANVRLRPLGVVSGVVEASAEKPAARWTSSCWVAWPSP
jgi:hypothetical protein